MKSFEKDVQEVESRIDSVWDVVDQALEAWYMDHFHRGVLNGTPIISAADKSALHKAVKTAITKE